MGNCRVVGNLIYSGVPERFPDVKFVSVESGIGWIPFFLEALDHQIAETMPNERQHLSLLPSEYFRRQFYGCFWFETVAIKHLLDVIGVGNVLFETDFPTRPVSTRGPTAASARPSKGSSSQPASGSCRTTPRTCTGSPSPGSAPAPGPGRPGPLGAGGQAYPFLS